MDLDALNYIVSLGDDYAPTKQGANEALKTIPDEDNENSKTVGDQIDVLNWYEEHGVHPSIYLDAGDIYSPLILDWLDERQLPYNVSELSFRNFLVDEREDMLEAILRRRYLPEENSPAVSEAIRDDRSYLIYLLDEYGYRFSPAQIRSAPKGSDTKDYFDRM